MPEPEHAGKKQANKNHCWVTSDFFVCSNLDWRFCHNAVALYKLVGGCMLYRQQHIHGITINPHKYMYDHSELDHIAHGDTTNPHLFPFISCGQRLLSVWITAHHI